MVLYAFVLFEELPEHDFVLFAALVLEDLFDFAEALEVDLFALFMVFLPTEAQPQPFLALRAEVLLELFFVFPNIVFTSQDFASFPCFVMVCKIRQIIPLFF